MSPPKRIVIVVPGTRDTLTGNWSTAERWRDILAELGHGVEVRGEDAGADCDLLIALHARHSHGAISSARARRPDLPILLVLTGTDVYGDIHTDAQARASLDLATGLIVLQRLAIDELPQVCRARAHIIYQSARPLEERVERCADAFQVCVVANLRAEKDPLRAAQASRLLPAKSRIRVVLIGGPVQPGSEEEARAEERANPRFRWLGFLPHDRTRIEMARSHMIAITSLVEGSSNVLSEALVSEIPVLASRIAGLRGTLGDDYPGYYPAGDTEALATRLERAERDMGFRRSLLAGAVGARTLVERRTEIAAWRRLLAELKL